ncbi:MAG: acetylornithine transaminase [Actinomycetota bacterium]|nr:acetylornithine transaminase [Actinomycetota bacterium]
MNTYRRWDLEFVSGSGARLVDGAGRSYIDCVAGIAVASVGHAHPVLTEAIKSQTGALVHVSNLYHTAPAQQLAAELAALTGGMHTFLCNSGAEAIETAIKLARKWGRSRGRHRIVAAEGGFHGRTLGALAATGQAAKRAAFEPLPPGFSHVHFGDAVALDDAVGDDVAAVLLEPIQGEAGVVVAPEGYLTAARAACARAGALLILDEVQTGVGRTGAWWAHQHEGVAPDIMCLAKGLAGGLPIGACLAAPAVAAAFEPGDHGCTFGGGPVQSGAALAVLEIIASEGLLERAKTAGEDLMQGLAAIFGPAAEVRGRGLLIGVELAEPRARAVAETALERGLLVNDATPRVVRLTPPLVITDGDIHASLDILEEVAGETGTA